jgi:hypothetical protein
MTIRSVVKKFFLDNYNGVYAREDELIESLEAEVEKEHLEDLKHEAMASYNQERQRILKMIEKNYKYSKLGTFIIRITEPEWKNLKKDEV